MKRVALFIGVNRYDDPEINNLDCAEADATELYAFFKHRACYDDVRNLLSPDSDLLLDTAQEMAGSLSPDDLFLFFFAGHGVEYEGRHLLLCSKARYSRLKYHQHVVPLDLLKQETSKLGVHRVLILDACRSDLLKGERDAVGSGLRDVACIRRIVALDEHREGSLAILCSCDEGQQAREIPQLRQGLFSVSLLQVITEAFEASREVVLSDAFDRTLAARMETVATAYGFTLRQRPWIQRSGLPPVLIGTRSTFDIGVQLVIQPDIQTELAPPSVGDLQVLRHEKYEEVNNIRGTGFDKVLEEAQQLIREGNARGARDLLRHFRESGKSEDPRVDCLFGVILLCDRFIGSMRENEVRESESLLLPGLHHTITAGVAAYALAAIRHCFYCDHSMKEPPPTFRELKTLFDNSSGLDKTFTGLANKLKVCDEFSADWILT